MAKHDELDEQALAEAWQSLIDAHQARIDAVLFDDDRRTKRGRVDLIVKQITQKPPLKPLKKTYN